MVGFMITVYSIVVFYLKLCRDSVIKYLLKWASIDAEIAYLLDTLAGEAVE